MNPGGIRNELLFASRRAASLPGQVTYGELFNVQPFGNSLVVKTCTGAQIDALLEQQIFPQRDGRRILQCLRTASPTLDAAAAPGNRIDPSSIKLNGVTLGPTRLPRDDEQLPRVRTETGSPSSTSARTRSVARSTSTRSPATSRQFSDGIRRSSRFRRAAEPHHAAPLAHTSTVSPSRGISTPGTAAARSARDRKQWLSASRCTADDDRHPGRYLPHVVDRPSRSARPRGTTRRRR